MATGITKKNWSDATQIITREHYESEDIGYKIIYSGKIEEKKILSSPSVADYIKIIDNKSFANKLFYGDNLDVLKHLINRNQFAGTIKLIYIDPPYATNSIFHSRNNENSYKDDLIGAHYLEFMRQRLVLAKKILHDEGSIYVHLDNNMVFQIKIIMDEIFGAKNYRGLITRKKCSNKNSTRNTYGNVSDYILFYSKGSKFVWNRPEVPWSDEKIDKEYANEDPITGRKYKKVPIHAPGVRNGETGKAWRGVLPPEGKHWQYTPSKLDELDKNGHIYWSANGNPRRKVYLDESNGIAVQDIWLDVQDSLNQTIKITGYPTEKNPDLLKRIIQASSNKGDIVLDFFAGSGSTLATASELERRWIGIDNSSASINHIFKRFVEGVKKMGDYVKVRESCVDDLFTGLQDKNHDIGNKPKSFEINFNFWADEDFNEDAENIMNSWLQHR